ncbi:LacI family transcriptional regulator [Candidatus Pantoea deserta]|uniref:LacI family transcriptional regulator n=1 Tax=Candidatus Pantoea deserta TaxID=1869313 RepID=A0A3N4NFJ2_9GAMM|nr:LacI family DNA-binding transcriptional regulator [Pantoea deserta]RPD93077.1 LacI family transcriptional regulator [Pantoea deserta]
MNDKLFRRGPTVAEIATLSGLGSATVDRVINDRPGVKEKTRSRVLAAIKQLQEDQDAHTEAPAQRIAFICEAGSSFITIIEHEVKKFISENTQYKFTFDSIPNIQVNSERFSALIHSRSKEAEGIILVSRDEAKVNRAVRGAVDRGVPVICLTTDLPNSRRTAYVGVDQVSTGATAAWLMGKMLPKKFGKILLLFSASYRTQEEREIGFRRVLRTEYPHLHILERVNFNDEAEGAYISVRKFLLENEPMAGIYNMAGGNRGVARALSEFGLADRVLFFGHELSSFTRTLLDTGEMDIVLGHDVQQEIQHCINILKKIRAGKPCSDVKTALQIYNKNSWFD